MGESGRSIRRSAMWPTFISKMDVSNTTEKRSTFVTHSISTSALVSTVLWEILPENLVQCSHELVELVICANVAKTSSVGPSPEVSPCFILFEIHSSKVEFLD